MLRSATQKYHWFSAAEYQRRLGAVRREIARRGLDCLIVFSPANVYYVTGHHSIDSWEFRAAVLRGDRDPVLLLYEFERGRYLDSAWVEDARFYQAGDDPVDQLASLIRDLGLNGARIGIESGSGILDAPVLQALKARLESTRSEFVDRLVDDIRRCKSPEELACIERAAELSRIGVLAAARSATQGALDQEVAAAAASAMLRAGSHCFVMMPTVAVGPRSGLAHSEHAGRRIDEGDTVFIELSGCWRHYSAPLMANLTVGEASVERDTLHAYAERAAEAILDRVKPGVAACEVAQAGRRALAGLPDEAQFHFNFGYSVGISFPPHWLEASAFYLKENNPRQLEAGMVFHLPLTVRRLGRCSAGLSHTIVITQGGCRILTRFPCGPDPQQRLNTQVTSSSP